MDQEKKAAVAGVVYGIAAFGIWGVLPAYWKLLKTVPPLEILSHRIIWSLVFAGVTLLFKGELGEARRAWNVRSTRNSLCLSATLIGVNWGTYIWAVNTNHIIETSLGYYISPLFSMLLGVLIFREDMNFWQYIAVGLSAVGVGYLTLQYGKFPWIGFTLALSLSLYGLLKKAVPVASLQALTIETLLISPLCLAFLGYQEFRHQGAFEQHAVSTQVLLVLAGVVTSLPLFCFAQSAKMIPLSQVGFLQYLSPSLALLLGIFVYGEAFSQAHAVSFICIWTALLIYSFSGTSFMRNLAVLVKPRWIS
ncbi:protein RarD [candidate division KSB3 bacterium]|uniref:Protein RarD n=1 Tax=candidate division KSB3 bacterium TaxID=2044937 RepID=A0A2G6E3W7_9BACT|nr:MAG: protein RarD [candidate division KSB3 bacterium]PIE29364.1 MAG: protein RarD [candidate division KSB3 bacterium]